MKKIYILGGGIAGLEAAIALRQDGFSVTVVSERDFVFVHPISIWIPTGEKSFEDVCIPLNELAKVHKFDVLVDEVVGINAAANNFTLRQNGVIGYDYLIIALGSEKIAYEGAAHTLSICGKPEDSLKIKEKIDSMIATGGGKLTVGFAGNPIDDTSGVRDGAAFEFMFNIHNMLKKRGIRDKFQLTFFAPMQNPGDRLGEKAVKELNRFFSKHKIITKFGTPISCFEQNAVVFEDGTKIDSDFIMFVPGRLGHELMKTTDLPLSDAGFVKINPYCQVQGYDNVFAIGDVTSLEGPDWRVKQGHVAEVMARNAAFNIFSIENHSDARRSYIEQLNLIFMLDMGDSASLVYRDSKRDFLLPIPVVGHWLKKGWGRYYRLSRLCKIPRLPGA
ncbi:MAG: FAD-dependent oxidoreductase [Campylobacterales bacterium]|nr:FAD-dependent oxidoreductase [Campylobacterales bacterium]